MTKMSVQVKESTLVYPAEDTPKGSLWLSRLDMMLRQPLSHTRVLHIYPHPNKGEPSSARSSTFFDVDVLKRALSKALVPYYPLAGRLIMNESNGRYEIDCNAEGALFVEAETTCTLDDLGEEIKPNLKLRRELIPTCDYSKGLSSFPLLIVQVTRFGCGGVTLGIATHHNVADGFAYKQFTNSWATLARGLELSVLPSHDRAPVAPRNPPQIKFRHLEYEPSLPPILPKSLLLGESITTTEHLFKLSEDQVKALKLVAMCPDEKVVSYKLSTFLVVAAHVWRNACKARELADDQDVKLYINTDGRSRMKDPPLPEGYFGNVVFFASCIGKAGDVVRNPLWYTIGKIDEAVRKMNDVDYLKSAVDYLESQEDLTALVLDDDIGTSPNFQINSWTNMPISQADFGWGGPKLTGLPEFKGEGQCKIVSNLSEDKSLYVLINLFTPHMVLFQKYFYDF